MSPSLAAAVVTAVAAMEGEATAVVMAGATGAGTAAFTVAVGTAVADIEEVVADTEAVRPIAAAEERTAGAPLEWAAARIGAARLFRVVLTPVGGESAACRGALQGASVTHRTPLSRGIRLPVAVRTSRVVLGDGASRETRTRLSAGTAPASVTETRSIVLRTS